MILKVYLLSKLKKIVKITISLITYSILLFFLKILCFMYNNNDTLEVRINIFTFFARNIQNNDLVYFMPTINKIFNFRVCLMLLKLLLIYLRNVPSLLCHPFVSVPFLFVIRLEEGELII